MDPSVPKYTATINYIMKPPLAVYCEISKRDGRYKGLDLADDELLADNEDSIVFTAFVARNDQENKSETVDGSLITHALIVTDDAFETPAHGFELILDDGTNIGTGGKLASPVDTLSGYIQSKKILPYTAENNKPVKVVFKGAISRGLSSPGKYVVLDGNMAVKLRFYKVFMRVLSGKHKNTSEVWAALRVFPRTDRPQDWKYTGTELEAKLEAASGNASIVACDDKTYRNLPFFIWTITYSGITWDNSHLAEFTVKVGIPDQNNQVQNCISFSYNVGRNLYNYLHDFDAAAPTLNLTNPDYNKGGLWDKYFPLQEYKGFFNNVRTFFGGTRTYECGELTSRIFNWSVRRKFGSFVPASGSYSRAEIDMAETMNGIELAYYAIAPIHSFFGFYLSGTADNARFIDPWWYQVYDDHSLVDWSAQSARLLKLLSPILIPGSVLIFATAAGTTLAAMQVVIISYLTLGTGGLGFTVVVNGGAKLTCGKYVFYVGDNTDQYMTAEKGCYDDYNNNGQIRFNWGVKIMATGELDNPAYTDVNALSQF